MTDETKQSDGHFNPLIKDTPASRVAAGGLATAILGSLGYIASAVLDVGREVQQAIDQGVQYRTLIEGQISTMAREQERIRDRLRAVEQEQTARQEIIDRVRREHDSQ